MTKYIYITTQFEGYHCWPDAPAEVNFLRHRHRHMFHVKVEMEVHHDDRELEFFLVKRYVDTILPSKELGVQSCEMIATHILHAMQLRYGSRWCKVTVNEDNENGAYVVYGR